MAFAFVSSINTPSHIPSETQTLTFRPCKPACFYAASLSVPDGIRPALGFVPRARSPGLSDVVELVSPWSPPPVGRFPAQD